MKNKILKMFKINNKLKFFCILLILIGILSISLGYSAFFTTLSIQNNLTYVRLNRNIRVTALSVEPTNPSVAQDFYHEYNEHTLAHRIRLANNNSSITYKVKVTNFGNSVEGILDINNLPSELTYTLSGYDLRTKMCNGSNCANGMQKEFYITFKYKDPSIVRGVRDFEMVLDVVFSPFYTVTYNVNGGNPISPISKDVMYKDYYGTLPEPFRVGYTFNGWKYNGATITATSIMNTAGNHTLTAAWTPNNYTVVFNSNGGSVSPTSKTVTYDSTYGTLPTPTRRGYTFNGWFTMPSGGDQVLSTSHVAITSTQVLYAHWTPNNYTVTFNPNNGSVTPSSKIVTYDSTYGTLPTPTRTGYTFNGWFTAASGGEQVVSTTVVNIIADQTLYAHWTPNNYTIVFNANGGNTPSPTSKVVTYDSTYGDLATTSRTGYTFKGWWTAASGGTQIFDTTTVKVTSNTTLYAHWEVNYYYVDVNMILNGTTYSNGVSGYTFDVYINGTLVSDDVIDYYQQQPYGSVIRVVANSKTGYTLTNGDVTATLGTTTLVFNPTWTAKTFTVTFNGNGGGTPSPTSKTVTYDSTYGTLASVSRTGYNFDGWYTASSGGSKIVDTTTVAITSNQTLYAHWTAKSYSVSLTGSNATLSTTSINVTYGSTNTFEVTPSSGYYLNSITCTNGYTASAPTLGSSATGKQTVTVSNNSKDSGSTCTVNMVESAPSCSWGNLSYIEKNTTSTIYLTCTSGSSLTSTAVSTSNFSSSNTNVGRITSVYTSSSTPNTSVTYGVNLRGWDAGTFNMTFNAGVVTNSLGKSNAAVTKSNIPVVDFELTSTSVSLNLSTTKTSQIYTTTSASAGQFGSLTYSTSNSSVATVSSSGLITAQGIGNATITVKENKYNITRTISVNVSNNYVINYQLSNLNSSNNASTISPGSTYSTVLTPTNVLHYARPSSINVYIGGSLVSSSSYTYNNVDGSLTIPSVSGDLKIVATATTLTSENISFSHPKDITAALNSSNPYTISSVSITQSKQIRVFKFVPSVTAVYTFTSYDTPANSQTTDPYGYLFTPSGTQTVEYFDSLAETYALGSSRSFEVFTEGTVVARDDDSGTGFNFSFSATCNAGQTYYFVIASYRADEECTYNTITITRS